ncbi:MAG TPA: site-2 protease family protein [Candidatus Angelobacter sp.]|nr:site-2 protease family protein [Candidatus Angelobacter sp.]
MKTWSVFAGRVRGIEFRLHVTFFFLLVFILFIDSYRGGTIAVGRGFALTGLVLLSVVLHEVGHLMAAARLHRPLHGIVLLPTGGIAMLDPNALEHPDYNFRRELRIAIWGPVISGALAVISAAFVMITFGAGYLWTLPLVTITALPRAFFWINLFLLVANLLPAFPLDGGRVYRAWLAQSKDLRAATRQAVNFGLLFSAAFMLSGVLLKSQLLMLVGLFLFMAAQMEERTALFHSVVEAVHMEDIMLTQFSTLSPADTLEDALQHAVHSLQDDFPVVSGGDLVGVINRQIIVERLRKEGNGYVQSAMSKAFEIASRTESLASAFRKLTARGLTLIPIVDQERLVGIVTLQNLMHSMGLLAESRKLRRQMQAEDRL